MKLAVARHFRVRAGTDLQTSRIGIAIAILASFAGPVGAACNMTTADNTWHEGLDINDESSETKGQIQLVEQYHFTQDVESLRSGSSAPIPGDLEYTLNSVPNHYRALASYATWEIKNPQLGRLRPRTAECYFKRAIGFRAEDPQLRLLFGTFLHRSRRLTEARAEYELANTMGSSSAELFYNLGLLELDLGNIEAAREHAVRAYAMGYPLPGLRNKLDRLKNPQTSGR